MFELLKLYLLKSVLQDWGNEKLQRAQKTVDESPYDLEAWSILIREAQNRPIIEVRPVFEKLVSVFPSAGRYWKIYIEQEVIGYINFYKTIEIVSMNRLTS